MNKINIKNLILFSLLIAFLLPNIGFTQAGPPQTVEGLKTALWKAVKFLPETIGKVAGDTFNWLKNIWNTYIYPSLHKIWQKIDSIFGKEVQQKGPIIKEEFKKETQEMKQDIPQFGKSLWQKLKDFFRFR